MGGGADEAAAGSGRASVEFCGMGVTTGYGRWEVDWEFDGRKLVGISGMGMCTTGGRDFRVELAAAASSMSGVTPGTLSRGWCGGAWGCAGDGG